MPSFTYTHKTDEDVAQELDEIPPKIREAIREEVQRALHPGMPDPRHYLRAEIRDPESGRVYRGMLYLLEPETEGLRTSPLALGVDEE